jgi:6-phosphogluconolactonase (cycloisomerase 2 family)
MFASVTLRTSGLPSLALALMLGCGTQQEDGGMRPGSGAEAAGAPKPSVEPNASDSSSPAPKTSMRRDDRPPFEPKLADLDWAAEEPTHVVVVNSKGGSVSLVALRTMSTTKSVEVGSAPYAAVVTPDASTVAVGVEGEGKLVFLSLPDLEPEGEAKIAAMHHDHLVLSPDGTHILDANYNSDSVIGIDIATRKEAFRIEGASAPHVVKYGPSGQNIYVTCKKVTGIAIIDPVARELLTFHALNVNPRSLTFSPDETHIYFASYWVDGLFEMETKSGKVTRLLALEPPVGDREPKEVTYHGVEIVGPRIVLGANEGRSYVDAVDVQSGKLLDRLSEVSQPCCIETIPGGEADSVRVLVSNIGDGTVELVAVSPDGQLASVAEAKVGDAPKRVAFVPVAAG